MKHALPQPLLACLLAGLFASPAFAQERIYRCGNEYTNAPTAAQKGNCKLVSGGNVTVVPSPRPAAQPARAASTTANGARVDAPEQRARDTDARLILESELKKAEARRAELLAEYNNGEPEKLGPETRNHQKYLDRVAALKAALERVESDIAGLQRELTRLPASK
jgi:hypothetical protein